MINLKDTILSNEYRSAKRLVTKKCKESDFYKFFNRRRYKSPTGYIDFDTVILLITRTLFLYTKIFTGDRFEKDYTHALTLFILWEMYKQNYAVYFVNKELSELFLRSTPPNDLTKLKKVVHAGIICLPSNLITTPSGLGIKWLCFRFIDKDTSETISLEETGGQIQRKEVSNNYLAWAVILNDEYDTQYCRSIKLDNNYKEQDKVNFNCIVDIKGDDVSLEKEYNLTKQISGYLIQVLLYLQTNEQTIHIKQGDRVRTKSNNKVKGKLPPNIIGHDFKPKYLTSNTFNPTDKHHKCTHVRRGHYRWQPYGEKNSKYKSIWIEPTIINKE